MRAIIADKSMLEKAAAIVAAADEAAEAAEAKAAAEAAEAKAAAEAAAEAAAIKAEAAAKAAGKTEAEAEAEAAEAYEAALAISTAKAKAKAEKAAREAAIAKAKVDAEAAAKAKAAADKIAAEKAATEAAAKAKVIAEAKAAAETADAINRQLLPETCPAFAGWKWDTLLEYLKKGSKYDRKARVIAFRRAMNALMYSKSPSEIKGFIEVLPAADAAKAAAAAIYYAGGLKMRVTAEGARFIAAPDLSILEREKRVLEVKPYILQEKKTWAEAVQRYRAVQGIDYDLIKVSPAEKTICTSDYAKKLANSILTKVRSGKFDDNALARRVAQAIADEIGVTL